MEKESILGVVMDSLSLFGDNTKTALLLQMKKEGIMFTTEEFEINKFCKVIEDLLGNHADFIIAKIVDDFCKQSKTTLDELQSTRRKTHSSNTQVLQSLFQIADGTNAAEAIHN